MECGKCSIVVINSQMVGSVQRRRVTCVAASDVFCGIVAGEYIVNSSLGDTVLECVQKALREGHSQVIARAREEEPGGTGL